MYLTRLILHPENFPTRDFYPFNLEIFRSTGEIQFQTPVTFFIGENGTGKSTLLRAIAKKCAIPVWKETDRQQLHVNNYAEQLYRCIEVEWAEGSVSGSFFDSEIFQTFAQVLDEWAVSDPEMLKYFGGESLVTKSHGQCNMSYFKSRYQIKGLYLLDEPETALSPRKQLELLKVLNAMSRAGHAQFIVATHSPILLALPEADIYSFDNIPLKRIQYEETDYYRIYKNFLDDRERYLKEL